MLVSDQELLDCNDRVLNEADIDQVYNIVCSSLVSRANNAFLESSSDHF